jgi:protein-S-isoprenylcysteine O-methyltransferase Ste14
MSMLQEYLDMLARASVKHRSIPVKIIAVILGFLTFFVLVPFVLFFAANPVETLVPGNGWRTLKIVFSLATICLGLMILAWSTLTQARIGRGTPVPVVPPQKPIVSGPYKLCRNPVQLRAMLFYLGVGTFFGSVKIGMLMLLFSFILGTSYHKLVEEKELLLRFGREYEEYKARTPFLLPKI